MAAKDQQYVGTMKPGESSPFPEAVVNDVEFTNVSRWLYIGVTGDVTAVKLDGSTILFKGAVAGSVIPVRVKQVNASGTTATNIVALG